MSWGRVRPQPQVDKTHRGATARDDTAVSYERQPALAGALAVLVALYTLNLHWPAASSLTRLAHRYRHGIVVLLTAAFLWLRHGRPSHPPGQSLLTEVLTTLLPDCHRARLLLEDFIAVIATLWLAKGLWTCLTQGSWAAVKTWVVDSAYDLAKHTPPVARRLDAEVRKMEEQLEHELKGGPGRPTPLVSLPEQGRGADDIILQMQAKSDEERLKYEGGQVSGAVYHGGRDLTRLLIEAYGCYSLSNPLHPDIWPSVNQMESEVVSMTARLVDGGSAEVCGALTSGGTESIVLAIKAHRDFHRVSRNVTAPEMIAATSAHAAVEKACAMLGIRLVQVPVHPVSFKINVGAVRRAVSVNTIMIYASAPSFAQGIIDPVEELSTIALQHDVGLHVDCCLGGFVLPFAKALGYDVPAFDFAVKGVTSMSVDTHKYGYASKGTSVVLYRNKALRAHQYFCFPGWSGGLYVTPTIAGSRPGGLIAACWAAMASLGQEGYRTSVKSIMDTAREIAAGVAAIPELRVLGDPKSMIVCIVSEQLNPYRVSDHMAKLGWSLNVLQRPPCFHLCVTLQTVGRADRFLDDLKAAVAAVLSRGDAQDKENSNAAIYGMAASLPPGPLNLILQTYTDVLLKP